MSKPLIVVTGKNGQLGWELQQLARSAAQYEFMFVDSQELDLSAPAYIADFFKQYSPNYFINCAAYTLVDKAETEKELAYRINTEAPAEIAKQCALQDCVLIQLSTDYVFDGMGTAPYPADAPSDPVNYYGYTKAEGERLVLENHPAAIIIRTAWLYSSHGNNFVKTMLRLMSDKEEIKVVDDQIGSPTYAADLAAAILQLIDSLAHGAQHKPFYQYSNTGVISWFDFATAIKDLSGLSCRVLPQPSAAYPTPAKRPSYSVMDTSAIHTDFGIQLEPWEESLKKCLNLLSIVK